jgi:hypothetical protein
MTSRLHTIACAIGCLLVPVSASAATRTELSLAAGLDSAYDDNVFNGRGPDFVNRVTPKAALRVLSPRLTLAGTYELGYWTYAFGKAENSLNHGAALALDAAPTRRLSMHVADDFVRAQDPGFIARVGVVAPQIGIIDNLATLSIGYRGSRRFYGALGYAFHLASFDSPNAQQIAAGGAPLFDGSEHDGELSFGYRVTHLDDLHLAGRIQLFGAGPQHTAIEQWNLGAAYSPTAGWRRQLWRDLEATVDVGPIFYQAFDASVNVPGAPGSGITWRLNAKVLWATPSWRASLTFARDLLGATGLGTAVWADYAYAQLSYRYLSRVDAHVGGGYFRNGRAVDQPVSYDGFTADVLVDWRVIDYFRLGAYYTLRWQETGPGAIPPGAIGAQFPNVIRNIVGIRLLAVLGSDARPPRREVHE